MGTWQPPWSRCKRARSASVACRVGAWSSLSTIFRALAGSSNQGITFTSMVPGSHIDCIYCATLQLCTAYRWQDSRSAELRLAEVLTSGMGCNAYVYMAWSEATNLRCCSATAVLGFKFETSGLGSVGVQGLGDSRLILRHLTQNPWKCLGFRLSV